MSIHAHISQEAETRLKHQKRNSTITSIFISILAVVLVALVLGVFLLPAIVIDVPRVVIISTPPGKVITKPKPKVNIRVQSNPSAPSKYLSRALVATKVSTTSIPVLDIDLVPPSANFGDSDFGKFGDEGLLDTDDGFKKIPPAMRKRCSKEDRIERLREMGGRTEAEEVVEKGLEWLKSTQNSDGSWTGSNRAAMTGFAVLAYLGRCETPISEKYGESCLRGITYLIDLGMKNNGKIAENPSDRHWPYEHAIATYALCEATTFCQRLKINIPDLREVARLSTEFIIENQHAETGGWDYAYDTGGGRGGDLSISAWHIQALKAASHTGIEFNGMTKAKNAALDYVKSKQGGNGGFGYTGPPSGGVYAKLTGAGMLCLQMWGEESSSSVRKAGRHLSEFSKFEYLGRDSNLYSQYYDSQALMARGGSEWRKYNEMFRDQLVDTQNADGSWKVPGSGGRYTNAHYRNCLNILMLEVYYRFLHETSPGD